MALVFLSACGKKEAKETAKVDSDSSSTSLQETGSDAKAGGKFEFKIKDGDGQTAFYLKYDGEDGKLLNGKKEEICRYKRKATKLKIVDMKEAVIGYVAGYPTRFKIEDESGKEQLQYQKSDSDWKLKNEDKMLLRIKSRDYGFETEKPDDSRYCKVKVKDGKKSLRDKDEKTVLYTKDNLSPQAMVPLGFKALDERVRFGIALAIQIGLGRK